MAPTARSYEATAIVAFHYMLSLTIEQKLSARTSSLVSLRVSVRLKDTAVHVHDRHSYQQPHRVQKTPVLAEHYEG
jgi:hypothetical protein